MPFRLFGKLPKKSILMFFKFCFFFSESEAVISRIDVDYKTTGRQTLY